MNPNYENANVSVAGTKAQVNKNDDMNSHFNFMSCAELKMNSSGLKAATDYMEEIANNGNANAAYFLSLLYFEGEICKQNLKKGAHYLKLAALNGHADAQLEIGVSAFHRYESEEEKANSFYWIHEAALNGLPEAEFILGFFYSNGFGCKLNKKLGQMWMKKAQVDNFDYELTKKMLNQ